MASHGRDAAHYGITILGILLSISNVYMQTIFAGLSLSTWESQLILLERIVAAPGGRWFWREYRLEFEESFREIADKMLGD